MEKQVNILVVEDNKGASVLLKMNFKQSKLNVKLVFTTTVREALSRLESLNRQNKLPQIILLDLSMPREDGWDFLDQYMKLDLKESIKIIILTTSINMKDKLKGREYPDVVAYYNKPITIAKTHDILNLYERLSK